MVIFNDNDEAEACDTKIKIIRKELNLPENYEFHYKKDSDRIKKYFFEMIAPYNFFYYWIIINKELLISENLHIKEPFYKYVCSLVFENAKEKINNATVIIDWTYNKDFEQSFQRYLKKKFNVKSDYRIKKVKMQDSKKIIFYSLQIILPHDYIVNMDEKENHSWNILSIEKFMYKFGQNKNPHLSPKRKLRAKLYLFGVDSIPSLVYTNFFKMQIFFHFFLTSFLVIEQ